MSIFKLGEGEFEMLHYYIRTTQRVVHLTKGGNPLAWSNLRIQERIAIHVCRLATLRELVTSFDLRFYCTNNDVLRFLLTSPLGVGRGYEP